MKRLLLIFLFLAPLPAKADAVPGYLLDKVYEACMKSGDSNSGMEAQKQQYCLCIRGKMTAWDSSTYEQLGKEMQNGNQTPPMLQDLAQQCIGQTLK